MVLQGLLDRRSPVALYRHHQNREVKLMADALGVEGQDEDDIPAPVAVGYT